MRRWLSNLGSAALALVLAVSVWVVASREENPSSWLPDPLPVNRTGLRSDLSIFGETVGQVRVELRAPKQRWQYLQASDFLAWVDLSDLGRGEYDVPVQVKSPDPQVQVLTINPPMIRVRLEERREKLVPVRVNVLDAPASGYDWQRPVVTPTNVLVSGAAPIVEQVVVASVDIYLRGARSTVERSVRVTVQDVSGEPAGFVTVTPREVSVIVPIVQLPGYREIAVLVEPQGQPAPGYTISAITASPKVVTLFGDPSVISGLTGYLTVPVDVAGATSDIVERVPLRLPENMSALGDKSVSVQVTISPLLGSQTVQRRPVIQGLAPGLVYTLTLDTVNVYLTGPMPKLDALKPDAVPVVLDLSGLGPGVHVVEPLVPVPEGVRVEGLSPESVEVTIGVMPTATSQPTLEPPPASPTAPAPTGSPTRGP